MRQPRYKRPLLCLLALCILLTSLAGCGGSKPKKDRTDQTRTEEEIFNKKITDFDPDRVVSLDGSEDNNFLVYQEDVVELTGDAVLSADPAAGVYTLSAGDPAAKALRKGDVFYVEPTAAQPDGITVKVAERKKQGDTVTITAEPEVALADLFEYTCVDMTLPASAFAWADEPTPDGVTLTRADSADIPALFAEHSQQSGILTPKGDQAGAGDEADDSAALLEDLEALEDQNQGGSWQDIPVLHYHIAGAFDGGNFRVDSALSGSVAVTSIHYVYKFHARDETLFSGVWSDTVSVHEGKVEVSGIAEQWLAKSPELQYWIPGTPLMVGVQVGAVFRSEGTVTGSYRNTIRSTNGATLALSAVGPVSQPIQQSDSSFDADLSVQGTLRIGIEGRARVGVPCVLDLFLELGAFLRAQAELATHTEHSDAIHDCTLCLAGKADVIATLKLGLDTSECGRLCPSWKFELNFADLETVLLELGAFYVSYLPSDTENDFTFGWGDCPYWRYRVEVLVESSSGTALPNARLMATYPDGRLEYTKTEENGVGTLHLPYGSNTLYAQSMGQDKREILLMDCKPAQITLRLEEHQPVVYYALHQDANNQDDLWPAFETRLLAACPDAIRIPFDELHTLPLPGDIVLDVSYWSFPEEIRVQGGVPLFTDEKRQNSFPSGDAAVLPLPSCNVTGWRVLWSAQNNRHEYASEFYIKLMTRGDSALLGHYYVDYFTDLGGILPLRGGLWNIDVMYDTQGGQYSYASYDEDYLLTEKFPMEWPSDLTRLYSGHTLTGGPNAVQQMTGLTDLLANCIFDGVPDGQGHLFLGNYLTWVTSGEDNMAE